MTPPIEAMSVSNNAERQPVDILDDQGHTVARVVEAHIDGTVLDRNQIAVGLVELDLGYGACPKPEYAILERVGGGLVRMDVIESEETEISSDLRLAFIRGAARIARDDLQARRLEIRGESDDVKERLIQSDAYSQDSDVVGMYVAAA